MAKMGGRAGRRKRRSIVIGPHEDIRADFFGMTTLPVGAENERRVLITRANFLAMTAATDKCPRANKQRVGDRLRRAK